MELTKKEKKIIDLAERNGSDKDLLIIQEIDALEDKFDETTAEIKTSFKETVKEIKDSIPDLNKVLESVRGKDGKDSTIPGPKGDKGERGEIGFQGKQGIQGLKGEKGDRGESGIDGLKGEQGEKGKDGSPDTSEQVRDKLESLKGKERLDISAIEGLEERIKAIPERPTTTFFGPGKTKIYIKDLSALLDGATKTFYIGTHFGISGVWGSSSPFAFRPVIDYNESGKNIVFAADIDASVALATGQTLIVQYLY